MESNGKTIFVFVALLGIGVVAVLGIIIYVFSQSLDTTDTIAYSEENQGVEQEKILPTATPSPLDLSLTSSKDTVNPGETFTVTVNAASSEEVLAIDLYLSFDPKMVTVDAVKPGTYYTDPILMQQLIDNENGQVAYSLSSLSPENTQGSLIEVTLTAKQQTGTSVIAIDSETLASMDGAVKGDVTITNNKTITVN